MQTVFSPSALLFIVCVAQFILPFMMAGVSAILPPIGADLQASAQEVSLVTTFYALGLAIFQLASGSMGDIWGRRRIFLCGMGIFSLCTMALSFIDNIYIFLALRFVQGGGAAMFNASSLAILAAAAPPGMRGSYLGISGAAVYAGIACGPPLAGCITGMLTWRWLFLLTMLVALLVWGLMLRTVRTDWYQDKGHPFDLSGCAIYAGAMAALTFGGTLLQRSPLMGWALIGTHVALLAVFALWELRARHPLLDMRLLFGNKLFGLSALAAFVNYASSFGMLLFFSLYLQLVHHMDVMHAGLFLTIQFIIQAVTTPWAGRLSDRYGPEVISSVGVGLCGVGLVYAAFLDHGSSLWLLVGAQLMLGLGISFFAIPNTNVLIDSAGPEHLGQAAGLTGAVRTGGGLFNMVIISTTFGYYMGTQPVSLETVDLFLRSMRVDMILFGVLNLMAIGCALGRFSRKKSA